MAAYVVFEVQIRDADRWQDFSRQLKPVLEAAGARYLSKGGALKVYEGDWSPPRLSILEFPSAQAIENFYNSPEYQRLIALRNQFSSARFVSVDGWSS